MTQTGKEIEESEQKLKKEQENERSLEAEVDELARKFKTMADSTTKNTQLKIHEWKEQNKKAIEDLQKAAEVNEDGLGMAKDVFEEGLLDREKEIKAANKSVIAEIERLYGLNLLWPKLEVRSGS